MATHDARRLKSRRMFLDLPVVAWVIITVEFFERLAYYGAAFTLSTYCTNMLGLSESTTNIVVNMLYVVAPLSACIASGIADGPTGRPKVLLGYLVVYALGLTTIAISSFPFMYDNFPLGPSTASLWMCIAGVLLFGCGYGGMKVCTSPITADAVSRAIDDAAIANKRRQLLDAVAVGVPAVDEGAGGDFQASGTSSPDDAVLSDDVEGVEQWTDEDIEFKKARLSFLFRMIYWSINFGSLFGIIGAPLLRSIDDRTVPSGSGAAHTGYYAGFLLCAVSTSVGTLVYLTFLPWMERNQPSEAFLMPRVLLTAAVRRFQFAVGSIHDDAFLRRHRRELLVFAAYRGGVDGGAVGSDDDAAVVGRERGQQDGAGGAPSSAASPEQQARDGCDAAVASPASTAQSLSAPAEADRLEGCLRTAFPRSVVASVGQTLSFCRAFATLPLYWLISNQFSTNIVLTANNMSIPDGIPPEALNNVNTISLLVTVFVVDKWIFPWWFGKARRPCVESRMVVGFVLVSVAMAWCGVLQMIIDHRGHYDDASEDYTLRPGASYVSVMWMLGPYALQGIASVFVDTTVLESAYVMAPPEMKSTVMALYLTASSASGFLGIAFAPLADQKIVGIMYFVLALLQGLVTIAFLRVGMVAAPGEALPLLSEGDTTG